jgi:hypothetical protein
MLSASRSQLLRTLFGNGAVAPQLTSLLDRLATFGVLEGIINVAPSSLVCGRVYLSGLVGSTPHVAAACLHHAYTSSSCLRVPQTRTQEQEEVEKQQKPQQHSSAAAGSAGSVSLIECLPRSWAPYAQLMRIDKPIGEACTSGQSNTSCSPAISSPCNRNVCQLCHHHTGPPVKLPRPTYAPPTLVTPQAHGSLRGPASGPLASQPPPAHCQISRPSHSLVWARWCSGGRGAP